jgi:hypothetical protein
MIGPTRSPITAWISAFELSENVLLLLVGTTTANVIGLFAIVAKYHFPRHPVRTIRTSTRHRRCSHAKHMVTLLVRPGTKRPGNVLVALALCLPRVGMYNATHAWPSTHKGVSIMTKKKGSKVSRAAKELSERGASRGGKARASKLSAQERSDLARRAAAARWEKEGEDRDLPRALCGGKEPLRLGDVEIPCYVLEDERRVVTSSGLLSALGMGIGGGLTRLAGLARTIADNPSMAGDLVSRLESPIEFIPGSKGIAKGYEATILGQLCDAILEARVQGRLTPRYDHIGAAAEVLARAFMTVGIIALVDEATGYQEVRRRMDLAEILDRYLDDNLNRWTKTFPDEFYVLFFKLKGWDYENLKAGDFNPLRWAVHS